MSRARGNLKFAAPPLPADDAELERLGTALGSRPRWLASSTHPGEEEIIGRVHQRIAAGHPGLLTIIVPRHPDRGPAIAADLSRAGLTVAVRSAGDAIAPETGVYVADTMGELGLFYRLADVAFMGKSLVPLGGQNALEAVRLGCAVVQGPHVGNFAEMAGRMKEAGASIEVADEDGLAEAVARLIDDDTERARRKEAADAFAGAEAHVLDDVMAELRPFLDTLRDDGVYRCWPLNSGSTERVASSPPPCRPSAGLMVWAGGCAAPLPVRGGRRCRCSRSAMRSPVAPARRRSPWISGHGCGRAASMPIFLIRGYGGAAAGPLRVEVDRHTYHDVGDEALLLARVAPTWVARDRAAGAREAVAAGASALVLDDAHQNPALVKDVSLLVVDGGYGFGNGRVIPAGPLREPVADAMGRAHGAVLMGSDASDRIGQMARSASVPVLRAEARPGPEADALAGKPVVAFAGIGRPGQVLRDTWHPRPRGRDGPAFPRPPPLRRRRRGAPGTPGRGARRGAGDHRQGRGAPPRCIALPRHGLDNHLGVAGRSGY